MRSMLVRCMNSFGIATKWDGAIFCKHAYSTFGYYQLTLLCLWTTIWMPTWVKVVLLSFPPRQPYVKCTRNSVATQAVWMYENIRTTTIVRGACCSTPISHYAVSYCLLPSTGCINLVIFDSKWIQLDGRSNKSSRANLASIVHDFLRYKLLL